MSKKSEKKKTLANLEQNECRWPIGDPRDPRLPITPLPDGLGQGYVFRTQPFDQAVDVP